MSDISLFAAIGFLLAAYAVVGNDALQTLGTFINSNAKRLHWTTLFAFATVILVVVFAWGFETSGGDPAFGRLDKYAEVEVQWYHVVPALSLLILTRVGIPVSTTFMVLTIFATSANLTSMLEKSLTGYGVAFLVGGLIYLLVAPTAERFFLKTRESQHNWYGVLLQWVTTAYLWGQWLMQDFANIFVFLPRELGRVEAYGAIAAIGIFLFITFANAGGPVQKILRSKTAVTDIRSATIIDFLFGTILWYFKELNNVPMSTTWVFLGLIAGREFVLRHLDFDHEGEKGTSRLFADFVNLLWGYAISTVRYVFRSIWPFLTVVSFFWLFPAPEGVSNPLSLEYLQSKDPVSLGIIGFLIVGRLVAQFVNLDGASTWFDLELEDVVSGVRGVRDDAVKALIGLVISVVLATGLPRIGAALEDRGFDPVDAVTDALGEERGGGR
ncbi:MAG: hypothetical protein AAFR11_00280 [Pseudomonadota bacterium]